MTVTYEWSRRHERQAGDGVAKVEPTLDMRRNVRVLLQRIDVDEAVRRGVVHEAIRNALACTWRRKAAELEWARPRPDDYPGQGDPRELDRRDLALADAALACRRKADMLEAGWFDDDE